MVPPALTWAIGKPSARSRSATSTMIRPSSRPASAFDIRARRSLNLPRWVVTPSSSSPGSSVEKARERRDPAVVVRGQTDAVEAGVDLDVRADHDPLGDRRRAQAARLDVAVDVDRHARPSRHARHPLPLVAADGGIRDDDVGAARIDEHLGLGGLGRRDAARPGRELHGRDRRRLVRLYVRPQPGAVAVGHRLPRGDVPLHAADVDDERRRRHLGDGHPGLDVGHHPSSSVVHSILTPCIGTPAGNPAGRPRPLPSGGTGSPGGPSRRSSHSTSSTPKQM